MGVAFEGRFFGICLDRERKGMMTKALDVYIDRLEERQAPRSLTKELDG